MNTKIQQGMLLLSIILFTTKLSAQTDEWKTILSKDGKTTVKYNFSSRMDDDGDKVPVVETITTTTDNIDIDYCISLMKDISKHKEFRGDKSSKLIKTVSENKWIIYYYSDKTLITPAVDGSYLMVFEEDLLNKTAVFTITADPTLVEKTNASRLTYVKETYKFKEIDENKLEITIQTMASPGFKVPAVAMKRAFPKKSFDNMEKFLKAAKIEKP